MCTGLIAQHWGPVVGGLFLSFPAILPASATLIERHETEKKKRAGISCRVRGRKAAALDAAGGGPRWMGNAVFRRCGLARASQILDRACAGRNAVADRVGVVGASALAWVSSLSVLMGARSRGSGPPFQGEILRKHQRSHCAAPAARDPSVSLELLFRGRSPRERNDIAGFHVISCKCTCVRGLIPRQRSAWQPRCPGLFPSVRKPLAPGRWVSSARTRAGRGATLHPASRPAAPRSGG